MITAALRYIFFSDTSTSSVKARTGLSCSPMKSLLLAMCPTLFVQIGRTVPLPAVAHTPFTGRLIDANLLILQKGLKSPLNSPCFLSSFTYYLFIFLL